MIRPAALRPGSRVALVAPAGPMGEGAVARAVARVRAWGWEPVLGTHCEGRHGYLSAPDECRAGDLQAAIDAPDNDALWMLRGGYGTMRILDRIDWTALRERPRPLIGYSDNTALHLALQRAGVVSFHGPHPATPEFPAFSEASLRRLVCDPSPAGVLPFPDVGPARAETVVPGVAEGPLLGGNLSLVSSTLGTPFAIRAEGAILFLEEVGESSYRLDRLLTHLRLAGVLDAVAGIALGGFTESPDAGRPDVPATDAVLRDLLGGLRVPVAYGFPFGHIEPAWTLPMGVRARLDADAGTLALLEPAVA